MSAKPYLKISIFLKKKPDVSDDFFHSHWKGPHAALATASKTFRAKTRKYNQVGLTQHSDVSVSLCAPVDGN
jgi:hypothetical protein